MANYWAGCSREVLIISLADGSRHPFYELDHRIKILNLSLTRYSKNRFFGFLHNIQRIVKIRKTFQEITPDIIISFIDQTNILTLFASRGLGFPVIVTEHTNTHKNPIGRFWKVLQWITYHWADKIIVLHSYFRSYFPQRIQSRIEVIPNPVVINDIINFSDLEIPKPFLLSMGRFSHEKGYDLLINAFFKLKEKYSDWSLVLAGDGPLRNMMEWLVHDLKLEKKVFLPGLIKDPYSFMKQAELFVLPSRLEGFPMALCEAMACGLPVISTEYHPGVREIIKDGENGVLIPPEDLDSLVTALDHLMGDKNERKRLAAQPESISSKFGLDKVMDSWDNLLQRILTP